MKQAYTNLMERLYLLCIVLSGLALVTITLIIPFGVFMRYVMNNPQSGCHLPVHDVLRVSTLPNHVEPVGG